MTSARQTTDTAEALINWAEVKDIELVVLKRMKEYSAGTHPSVFHGGGFDFVGLRDWQPGDRPADIDWPQSSLTSFSPLVTREFEQETTASLMIVADTSLSTRCGVDGVSIATVIARAVATLSLAGAFCQDQVGLVTLDGPKRRMSVRPRVGRNHAIHCIEAYQTEVLADDGETETSTVANATLTGMLRRRSLIPVVSDFLFEDVESLLDELAELSAVHDVFLAMVDCVFAFELPRLSSGWVETYDIETGRTRILSTGELKQLGQQVREWQDAARQAARHRGLDVVRIEPGREHDALSGYLGERRLRKR